MHTTRRKPTYTKFTPVMAVNIAAPHTWPAAIMPTLIALCAAAANGHDISIVMSIVILLIVVLMQSAVNTFNDYYDCVKGTDNADADVEESDAVLIYNNVNPKSALKLAIGFLVVAFVLGIYVIVKCGFIPLVIAIIGAIFVVCYSAGKTPVSYLPIGEFVSGFVMGGLIPLAAYQAFSGSFNWLALVWGIPTIIGVGLIMFTNNGCDIERDIPAGRHTLPVVLGRTKARKVYHACVYTMIAAIVVIVAVFFTKGLLICVFMLLAAIPFVKALLANPLDATHRVQAMSQVLTVHVVLCAFYAAAILASLINLGI